MITLLQQLPALLGVLVGAVTSYTTTHFMERSRWKRNQAARWDEKRLAAYADYGNAVKKMLEIAMRISAAKGFPATDEPLDPGRGLELLALAELDRAAKWETVLLLGQPSVIGAARRWHECVWKLEWYARGLLDDVSAFEAAAKDTGAARSQFYALARKDLGVHGDLPAAEPLKWADPSQLLAHTSGSWRDSSIEPPPPAC